MKEEGFMSKVFKSAGFRFGIICFLILLFMIPLGMVNQVVRSRSYTFNDTVYEITSAWGNDQTVMAPIITLPVEMTRIDREYDSKKKVYENRVITYEKLIRILPENLNIKAQINPQMRYRGIFRVLVNTTDLKITGNFENYDFSYLGKNAKPLWGKAYLSIGINPALIRGDMSISFDGKQLAMNPGSAISELSGLSAFIKTPDGNINKSFDVALTFNSSKKISFAPLGKKNLFEVSSTWAHPIFADTFRPDSPEISENGFVAKYNIPYIARDYPQIIENSSDMTSIRSSLASVSLFDTMPVYKQATRLGEYGVMFVFLTFIMMFLFERRLKRKMHYIQYVIIGLSIALFFLAVLSLSEYLVFLLAYAIASMIVISMISLYVYSALKDKKTAIISGLIMTVLYSILYLMLSEADYALLIGTFILLVTVGVIMWDTKNINNEE